MIGATVRTSKSPAPQTSKMKHRLRAVVSNFRCGCRCGFAPGHNGGRLSLVNGVGLPQRQCLLEREEMFRLPGAAQRRFHCVALFLLDLRVAQRQQFAGAARMARITFSPFSRQIQPAKQGRRLACPPVGAADRQFALTRSPGRRDGRPAFWFMDGKQVREVGKTNGNRDRHERPGWDFFFRVFGVVHGSDF